MARPRPQRDATVKPIINSFELVKTLSVCIAAMTNPATVNARRTKIGSAPREINLFAAQPAIAATSAMPPNETPPNQFDISIDIPCVFWKSPLPAFPRKLSQTGLFESVRGHRIAAGVSHP